MLNQSFFFFLWPGNQYGKTWKCHYRYDILSTLRQLERIWCYSCEKSWDVFLSTWRNFTGSKPQDLVLNSFLFKIFSNEPWFINCSLEKNWPYFNGMMGTLEPFPLFQNEKLILICFINWGIRFLLGRKGVSVFINKLENYSQYMGAQKANTTWNTLQVL